VTHQDFTSMRAAMIASQLRTNAVTDPRLIAAMDAVPRENFVPAERRALAYVDVAIPLGGGRSLNPPLATGRLLIEACLNTGNNVLLIGAATGYTAAVLAQLGVFVVAVEEDKALAAQAEAQLSGLAGVELVMGALASGCLSKAPYDAVIIDGAVEAVPQALWDQLRDGGVLVTAILDKGITRLSAGRRAGGTGALVSFLDADAAPLPGFAKPHAFAF
jgi:protein-L-isoaspartate(D-aspartate) O-methyltransferase